MEILSVLSTIIAVTAAIVSVITYYEMRRIAKIQVNLDVLAKGQDMLEKDPQLLELHGITPQQIAACGMSGSEFVYVLNSFYAGQAYHSIEGSKKIILSEYRRFMLDNEKVKQAWLSLIRRRMIANSPYAAAIDKYYNL